MKGYGPVSKAGRKYASSQNLEEVPLTRGPSKASSQGARKVLLSPELDALPRQSTPRMRGSTTATLLQ